MVWTAPAVPFHQVWVVQVDLVASSSPSLIEVPVALSLRVAEVPQPAVAAVPAHRVVAAMTALKETYRPHPRHSILEAVHLEAFLRLPRPRFSWDCPRHFADLDHEELPSGVSAVPPPFFFDLPFSAPIVSTSPVPGRIAVDCALVLQPLAQPF
jgi:hypothetical protein